MTSLVYPSGMRPLLHFNPMPIDCLPRDKGQSSLLHEPKFRISNIDPMTGIDVSELSSCRVTHLLRMVT